MLVDCVGEFLETMIRKRRDASSRQWYSKRRTEKLKTPDAKTERPNRGFMSADYQYFPKSYFLDLLCAGATGEIANVIPCGDP